MKGFSARRGINPILMLRSPLHVGRLTRHIRRPYLCNGLQVDAKAKHNPPNIVKGTGSIDAKLKVYKSQLYTIPNMITISRMCCSPLLTLAIINDEKMIALGGCCVAACGTARMRESFIGAVALMRSARFELDPRDERTHEDFYEVIGDDNGSFGCMTLLGCEDACPKELPLQTKIAYMRRKMVAVGMK